MRVLIIGGNGFIGSHLTQFLVDQGQEVTVYSRSQNCYCSPISNVTYITGDLADQALLTSALKNIDIVYQLVSSTVPSTSNQNPINDVNFNVINTLKLLESCVDASVKKVIFPSSGGTVYGIPRSTPIAEEHPTNPICSYGITKLMIEKYLALFHYLHGLDYTILRIANPYGSYQNPKGKIGAITIFLHQIMQNRPIQIWGDGEIIRDYLYIADVIQALYNAQTQNLSEKLFNIGSGEGISLNLLIEKIRAVISHDFKVEYVSSRAVDVSSNVLDISRAKQMMGWQPSIPLEIGLQKTWQWLKNIPTN